MQTLFEHGLIFVYLWIDKKRKIMGYENILIEEKNGIVVLSINRPKALNALNAGVFKDLDHFFTENYSNENVKAVVITGVGDKAFAAGADIKEFMGMSEEQGTNLSRKGMAVFEKIENFSKPVIAAVNGFSLGGGNELAMSCHFIVASEKARFGQPEVNLGLITGYGGTQRLPRYVGQAKAMELLLTGDMINAQEAKSLGLVSHVVEHGNEVEKSVEILNKIITKSPFAIAKMIETVNAFSDNKKNGFEIEANNFGKTISSYDGQEGAKAFLEKRKPKFKGR